MKNDLSYFIPPSEKNSLLLDLVDCSAKRIPVLKDLNKIETEIKQKKEYNFFIKKLL